MPSWTDENGNSWFGKLECKRCLQSFAMVDGEVPLHQCSGGWFKSATTNYCGNITYHDPVEATQEELKIIMKDIFLSRDKLEKLTTKRLLAYKKMLLSYPEGPSWEEHNVFRMNKQDHRWQEVYSIVKEILATRENVNAK
jgi:hypothetical protein